MLVLRKTELQLVYASNGEAIAPRRRHLLFLFRLGRLAAGVGGQRAAGQVFEPGHPQPALEFARQPAGHAHVVGVHVGAEDARDARALRRGGQRSFGRDQLAPGGQGLGRLGAGVDDGPAQLVAQAKAFLSGKSASVQQNLAADMEQAAEALEFERAFLLFDNASIDDARGVWRTLGSHAGLERNFWRQEDGRWIKAA